MFTTFMETVFDWLATEIDPMLARGIIFCGAPIIGWLLYKIIA
jgi:hypothetical protein